ncbi:MAG: Fic family protein [Bacteroidetes bacterium]|nr:Fic family protein [Bacteroidota bacterium]
MTNENTSWTPSPEDNLLGLTDKDKINQLEAKGIANAEFHIFNLDENIELTSSLVLQIHKIAFGELYDWAGKWRTTIVTVGQIEPPVPSQIPNLMYQYFDELNYKVSHAKTKPDHIQTLAYGHYEFVRIHPFNNGNGRTGRLVMNLMALKFGYQPLELYFREGESRSKYIDALRQADKGNIDSLKVLIERELTVM